jgi:FxLD family lantipeptide
MIISTGLTSDAANTGPSLADGDAEEFDLDVRIVEAGPVAAMLLGGTDDGCDTVQGSDC